MNGRKAKKLRKIIYKGKRVKGESKSIENQKVGTRTIVADLHRTVYQSMKKEVRHVPISKMEKHVKEL